MSHWAALGGIMSVEQIGNEHTVHSELYDVFGPMMTFQDLVQGSEDEDCRLPQGSEGSPRYRVVDHPYEVGYPGNQSSGRADVIIDGDLRDYEYADRCAKVTAWVKDVLERIMKKPQLVLDHFLLSVDFGEPTKRRSLPSSAPRGSYSV